MYKKRVPLMALAAVLAGVGVGLADSPANPLAPAPTTEPAAAGNGGFDSPLNQTVPDLRSARPPEWVKPGARIVYWLGSGSFHSIGNGLFKQDPNGDIEDTNGNRYSRQEGNGNVASAGYLVYTVHAITEKGEAILGLENYLLSGLNGGGLTPVGGEITKVDAAIGGGLWISPEKLAKAQPSDNGGFRVLVGPWEIDGRKYNAVSMAAPGMHNTFDRGTGMYLSGSTRSTSRKQAGFSLDGNTLTPESGTTTHSTVTQFKGFRYQKLPWTDMARPQWVDKGASLSYRATRWMEIPGALGEPVRFVTDSKFDVKEVGDGWVRMDKTIVSDMNQPVANPRPIEQIAGNNGGFWMNPAVFRDLKKDQVLDEDRLLGFTATVSDIGRLPDGRDYIAFQVRAKQFTFTTTYDMQSGVALRLHLFEAPLNSHVRIDLMGMKQPG